MIVVYAEATGSIGSTADKAEPSLEFQEGIVLIRRNPIPGPKLCGVLSPRGFLVIHRSKLPDIGSLAGLALAGQGVGRSGIPGECSRWLECQAGGTSLHGYMILCSVPDLNSGSLTKL